MTTMFPTTVKCSVCGHESKHMIIGSSNTFGSMDLDTRPAEMMRSTMTHWVQECPHCHYVSDSIDAAAPADITTDWLQENCSTLPLKTSSSLAHKFYRQWKIASYCNKPIEAFYAALHGAWACDDLNSSSDKKDAIFFRQTAIETMDKITNLDESSKNTMAVIRSDLLRRSEQFQKVIGEYQNKTFDTEILNQIIRFEVQRAKAQDSACYTVSDACATNK